MATTQVHGHTAQHPAPSATTGVGGQASPLQRIELPVARLTCANCVQTVEKALRAVVGVANATVNLAAERAFVDYDPRRPSRSSRSSASWSSTPSVPSRAPSTP